MHFSFGNSLIRFAANLGLGAVAGCRATAIVARRLGWCAGGVAMAWLGGGVAQTVHAAISVPENVHWTGDASSDWTDGKNWTAFAAGGPGSGNIASFDGLFVGPWQPKLDAALSIGQLVFDTSLRRVVTLGGSSTLAIEGLGGVGIDNRQSGYVVTIAAPLDVYNVQMWQVSAVSGGSLTVSGPVNLYENTLTLSPTAAASALAVNGAIRGAAGIVTTGAGTTTLSGKNTYSGGTTVDAGTLRVNHDAALGTGTLTLRAGSTLEAGEGARTLANRVAVSGDFTVGGDNDLTFTNAFDLGGGDRTMTVSNRGVTTLAGTVANGSAAAGLTKAGAGMLVLSGNATFKGAFAITEGTMELAANNTLSSHVNSVAVSSGATLAVAGGIGSTNTIGALTGSGAVTIAARSTLAVNQAGSGAFSGSLAGAGTFVKQGAGKLSFANGTDALKFDGTVRLDEGTLEFIGGALANHPTLGTLTLNGGTLLLNEAMLSVTTLRITDNTILDFGTGAASVLSAMDIYIVAGKTLTVKNWTAETDFLLATRGFRLADSAGTLAVYNTTGSAPQNLITFNGDDGGDTAWLNYDYDGYRDYQIRPIPEPSTYGAIFLAGCLGLLGWRRYTRRRRV